MSNMQIAVYGRLGQQPREISTKSGTPMAVCSMAVSLEAGKGEDLATQWLGLVAFNRSAEVLLKHDKGDLLSVSGTAKLNHWTGKDGERREQLQVVVDSLLSARVVRPGGGKKADSRPPAREPQLAGAAEFDDNIPF